MRSNWMLLIVATVIITGCKFQCTAGNMPTEGKEVSGSESKGPLTGAIIKNDIELEAKGVKIAQAFLADEAGNLLTNNEVQESQKINCVVRLDTGWAKYDGKSYIGASEKIMSGNGSVVLDEPDLFSAYTESGVSATDAKVVSVVATITRKEPGVDDYKVQFRMWDKRGGGEVTGSFKFKVK